MAFAKLTNANTQSEVYINPDHVVGVQENGRVTFVVTTAVNSEGKGRVYEVSEAIVDVVSRLTTAAAK